MFLGFDEKDLDMSMFSTNEIDRIRDIFSSLDKEGNGSLNKEKFIQGLDMLGLKPDEEETIRLMTYLDVNNRGIFDYSDFVKAIIYEKMRLNNENERDYVEAFVSMGGNEDKTGKINAQKLIEVIKDEFELKIDIERLIREVGTDESGEIEYDQFKTILSK